MSRRSIVVVITGASSGIGRATALRFARAGASLVLASRRRAALEELAWECERRGAAAIAVPTDVTSADQVRALGQVALARFGRIDVWVNDAGVSVFAPFVDMPLDDFRRVIDVDLMGCVYGSRVALEAMLKQGRGVLINVASVVGEVPQPFSAPYGMAKAAVRALGVSLRSELRLAGAKHIAVSTVLPATTDTPFFRHAANYTGRKVLAMPPVYDPDLVARVIVRQASAPHAEVVVGRPGKALVLQHRVTPRAAEGSMAALTQNTQLARRRSVPDTQGILYRPAPDEDAAVTGGWHGRSRTVMRRVITIGALLAVAAAVRARRT